MSYRDYQQAGVKTKMNIDEKDDLVKRMANAYRKRVVKRNKLKANDNHLFLKKLKPVGN